MGKGKQGCLQPLQADGQIELLAARSAWAPFLSGQLSALLSAAGLTEYASGQELLDSVVSEYLNGQGDELSVHDCLASFRAGLARLLAKDLHPDAAVSLLADPSLDSDWAARRLCELADRSSDADGRSRYRAGAALLFYEGYRFEEARDELKADIADSTLADSRRALAQQKLDALQGLEPPLEELARLVPQHLLEGSSVARIQVSGLQFDKLGGAHGYASGSSLIRLLSREGYHDRALKMADLLSRAQSNNPPYLLKARELQVEVLLSADRLDEAVRLLEELSEDALSAEGRDETLGRMVSVYEQAGLGENAVQVAKLRREQASEDDFEGRHMACLDVMMRQGMISQVIDEIDRHESLCSRPKVDITREAFQWSIDHQPDRAKRSRLRLVLCDEFKRMGEPERARRVLDEELSDPGLAPDNRRLAERLLLKLD